MPSLGSIVSDTLVCSRRIGILAVVDDFTRESLALVVDTSLSGARVAREADVIIAVRRKLLIIVSENGTELTSLAILRYAQDRRIEWHYIAPRQTAAEWLHRELQRSLARRMLERDAVRVTEPCPVGAAQLARRLQPCAAA